MKGSYTLYVVPRLLAKEGELTPERLRKRKTSTVLIPEGAREVVWKCRDRLSLRCNDTLTIASVKRKEFELSSTG